MKICCITNRHLAVQDYFTQIEQVAKARPYAIMVREKDLPEGSYQHLAQQVMEICERYQVICILHTYVSAAIRLGATAIHLPVKDLLDLADGQKKQFAVLGASVHSVEDAVRAQTAGASYVTAGHIYATDCKRGIPPRGLAFLQEVCKAVNIPVYALGGICADNAAACIQAGAEGVCIMSECMSKKSFHFL